jgi:ankyrin repeat protein
MLAGANAEAVTASGQTALHYAVQYLPSATEFLLEHGAVMGAKAKNGRNTLPWACIRGDEDCIRLLLKHAVDINEKSEDGESPPHLLAKANIEQLGTIKLLLPKGAIIDDADHDGFTPLHNAIKAKNFSIAAHLISQGLMPIKCQKMAARHYTWLVQRMMLLRACGTYSAKSVLGTKVETRIYIS